MFLSGELDKLAVDGNNVPSDEGNEWFERGDHPLLNDLVLDALFGFVRRSDLKSCGAVCQKWNLRTIPHMRATFRVSIHGGYSREWKTVTNFVNLFSFNEFGIPFESFNLGPFCTIFGVGQQFLQLCGESAKEIVLHEESDVYVAEDVSEILRSCPNLKTLGYPYNLISRFGNVVKLFPDSIPKFSSLRKITFRHGFYGPVGCCPSGIEELVTAAPNIQSLNVDLPADNDLMGFPHMPHLKSLAFKVNPRTDPKPVNLSQTFPVLERLDIEIADAWSEFFSQFESSPTIKSLSVQGRNMKIQTFNDILRVFPNLIKLDIRVGHDREEILRGIWSQMTELESLSLSIYMGRTQELSLDSLCTGIPTLALERVSSLLTRHWFNRMTVQQKTEKILSVTEQHTRLPSIRNLKKLRRLDLNLGEGTHLTDVTVFLAFYSMRHLRHLVDKGCMFSESYIDILTKETGLESWDFISPKGKDITRPVVVHDREIQTN